MTGNEVDLLFQKYYNDAMLYVLSFANDFDLAEDIVSTAFYRALSMVNNNTVNFKYWLLKVCRNLFFDHVRRHRRHKPLDDSVADKKAAVLDSIIEKEEYQALHRAIDMLENDFKEIILLHYFEQMKIKDIAELTSKSEANVKVILHRARNKLKEILEV